MTESRNAGGKSGRRKYRASMDFSERKNIPRFNWSVNSTFEQ